MSYKTPKEVQDKWIQAIKDCGQSFIDNAEKIAGEYEWQTSVYISMLLTPGEPVEINIDTTYLPKSTNGGMVILPRNEEYEFVDKGKPHD